MNAADRIAALREEYARTGEDVTGLSDAELLLRQLDHANTESRRHENNYTSLLQDQTKRERAVRAAASRGATEDRIAWAGMYLQHFVSQQAHNINGLIHRAAELPDGRVPVEQTRALKAAAELAKWTMSGLVGSRAIQLEDARRQNPDISLVEKRREEILRLRSFIAEQGQRLHAEYGGRGSRETGWRCECPGCELIRSTDDAPVDEAENAPTEQAA